MNLKKYFNWKIEVGAVAVINGIILQYYSYVTMMGCICPVGDPYCNYSLPVWLVFSIIPIITLGSMILIWGILEKILQRIGKSTKILNVVMIIVLGFFIAYLSIAIWLQYHPIQQILPNGKSLGVEHHYLCEDFKNCENCGMGNKDDMPVVKWLSDNRLSIIATTYIGTGGSTLRGVEAKLQDNNKLQIYIYTDFSQCHEECPEQEIFQCSEFIIKNIPRGNYQGNIAGQDIGPLDGASFSIPNDNQASETDLDIYRNEEYGFEFQIPGYTALSDNQHIEGFIRCTVEQEENKFTVCYAEGQSVEIFSKDPNQSLKQAIEEQFLQNSSPEMCWVEVNKSDKDNYLHASINYPLIEIAEDPNINPWKNRKFCSDYSKFNGVSGFMMDPEYPDRFAFFSIGQYALFTKDGKTWQLTFRFF